VESTGWLFSLNIFPGDTWSVITLIKTRGDVAKNKTPTPVLEEKFRAGRHPPFRLQKSAQCFMVGKKSDTERDMNTYRRMVGRRGLLGGGPGERWNILFSSCWTQKMKDLFLWGTLYFVLVDRDPRPGFEVPNEGTNFDLVKPPSLLKIPLSFACPGFEVQNEGTSFDLVKSPSTRKLPLSISSMFRGP